MGVAVGGNTTGATLSAFMSFSNGGAEGSDKTCCGSGRRVIGGRYVFDGSGALRLTKGIAFKDDF